MKHDCCKTDSRQTKGKKGVDTFLIGIVLGTVLLLGGAVYLGTSMGATTQVEADTQVTTQIAESRHDWGEIDINAGIVSKSFAIENTGSTPLKLYEVETSCMCTTAQLKTGGQSSRKFGMHDNSSTIFEVPAGETAELIVEFDPLYHGPSGVGPISRTVTVSTNDSQNPTLTFQLSAMVVKK